MNLKLNFYYPSIERGGLEKNLFALINSLAEKKYKINFVTYEDNTYRKEIRKIFYFHKSIKVIEAKSFIKFNNRYLKYFFCFIKLLTLSLKEKSTIVSFQGNIVPILVAKLTGNKIIIRCNTAPSKYINKTYKKIFFKFFYSLSDQIVVTSNDFKKEIKRYFNLSSIVHRQTLDIKNIKKKSKVKINFDFFNKFRGLKIVNVGRLTFQKDQTTLLKAFTKLIKVKEARLLLIGGGEDENKLTDIIYREGLKNYVKLIPFDSNPFKYIALSDVKILSSRFEGNPNILLEVASLKKLIISSNCKVGPSEILQKGKGGILFKVGNYNQLFSILKKLKLNDLSNKKKIEQSYNFVKKNFKKDIGETFIKNLGLIK